MKVYDQNRWQTRWSDEMTTNRSISNPTQNANFLRIDEYVSLWMLLFAHSSRCEVSLFSPYFSSHIAYSLRLLLHDSFTILTSWSLWIETRLFPYYELTVSRSPFLCYELTIGRRPFPYYWLTNLTIGRRPFLLRIDSFLNYYEFALSWGVLSLRQLG